MTMEFLLLGGFRSHKSGPHGSSEVQDYKKEEGETLHLTKYGFWDFYIYLWNLMVHIWMDLVIPHNSS